MNPSQLPQHIFGMHDTGAEHLFNAAGKPGWITITVLAGDGPRDFSALTNAGFGVIVRLNNAYGSGGTIPTPSQYDAFAEACARYVAHSQGAHIWIIGNETNLEAERPGNQDGRGGEMITPELYALCFAKCYAAIKNVPGHADDWIIPSPPGPWNPTTAYPTNPIGDWVIYFRDILNECLKRGARPDALALHTYSAHDVPMDANLVESQERMNPPYQERHWQFRAYRDFLGSVPAALRTLPVFITESQHLPWENRDAGWMQRAFAEINAWNANAANQPIQALCLFRWHSSSDPNEAGWGISDKPNLIGDFRAALQNDFRARWLAAPIATAPKKPTKPGLLLVARVRELVEQIIRDLQANHGAAARKVLSETVTPWFYASAPEHSESLPQAQAHTTARWFTEEATRRIEDSKLGEALEIMRDQVLAWLNSAGPSQLGLLGVADKPTSATKKKAAPKKRAARKPTAKKSSAKKSTSKKTRAKKPKAMLLSAEKKS